MFCRAQRKIIAVNIEVGQCGFVDKIQLHFKNSVVPSSK